MLFSFLNKFVHRGRKTAKRNRGGRSQQRPGFRPRLEFLEDRTLLATKIWTGAVDNSWNNNSNWNGGKPGLGDTAQFDNTRIRNAPVVDAAFNIAGLSILSSWDGSLTVTSNLTLTGASSWATGPLSIGAGGLTNNGTITVSGAAEKIINAGGTLTNNGTVLFGGSNRLRMDDNSQLLNASGATFNFQADVNIQGVFGGGGTFTNAGTITKTAGAGTAGILTRLSSSNIIDVSSGTLQLQTAGGTNTGGTFTVAANATLDLTGGNNVTYAGTYMGSGMGTVALAGGSLVIGTGGATFNFTGSLFQWSAGAISTGSGNLTNLTTGTLNLSGSSEKVLNGGGMLTNNGIIVHAGSNRLRIDDLTKFVNASGATYDFRADQNIQGVFGGGGIVTNSGTLTKTAGAATSALTGTLNFSNNNAAITVQTGTLQINSSAGVNTGGTLTVAASATLDLTGGNTVAYKDTYTGSGMGAVVLNSGTLAVAAGGATFNFPGGLFQWNGGAIRTENGNLTNAATGTITLGGGLEKILNGGGTLTNNGTILHGGGNRLRIDDTSQLMNASGATYNFQVDQNIEGVFNGGGIFTNAGTLTKTVTTGTSALTSTLSFNNNNAITVQTGTLAIASAAGINTGGTLTAAAGATLDLTGGRAVTYAGAIHGAGLGTLSLNSGTLSIVATGATFNIDVGLLFQWSGGSLAIPVNSSVAYNGTVTFSGGNEKILNGGGTLTNNGTILHGGSNRLRIDDNSQLVNTSSGTYNFQADVNIEGVFNGGGLITNAGTITKTGGTPLTGVSEITANFINSNILNVSVGTLRLRTAGGTSTGGNFTVAAGATLDLTGGVGVAYMGTYIGQGAGSVALSGGTLLVATGGATFNFPAGLFQWSAGAINTASGNLTNDVTGTFTLSSGAEKILNGGGTLTNNGTILFGGSNRLRVDDQSKLINASGATYNFQADVNIEGVFGGGGTVTNDGTLIKSAATGTSVINTPFTNTGTLSVLTGTLFLSGPFSNFSGTTLTGGTYLITGTLQFNNADIRTNAATIVLNGANSLIVNQSGINALVNFATNAAAGSFTIQNGRNFPTAGDFTNNGILTVGAGSLFIVNGALTNFAGTTLTGGTYNVAGTLRFNNANIVTLAATVVLDGASSQVVNQALADGLANLATIAATGSFTIQNGRNFTTAAALTNNNTLTVGAGSTLTVTGNYSQMSTLTVAAGGTMQVMGSFTNFSGGTLSGGTYVIAGTLQFTGANIITNAANLVLDGSGQIIDENGNNGLANFATNDVTGMLTLRNGFTLTTAGNFSNQGYLLIDFTSVLNVTGDYTQGSGATLEIQLGGVGLSGQLNITGNANLDGTLVLTLVNGYTLATGDTFQIMTFASRNDTDFANPPAGFDESFDDGNGTLTVTAQ